ncbi:glutamine--fructose-6-phosphate transaminase (isomerizing) [Candidatus Gracilibacteria bacterium]|nr:MAG: glutamine--fructose-6-phosphate transaminase (isomerizing) [Candidatus Gracilibacteria bacterium]
MCGVFGYLGRAGKAAPQVIAGLQRLEYRGYDSAGICVINEDHKIKTIKSVGKVGNLKVKVDSVETASYHAGIGHTRWATHGGVTETNCHPHLSESGRFVVIHNGIIENFSEIKKELEKKGKHFQSETDTEVTVQLFEDMYDGDHISTLKKICKKMHGAYGLVFMDKEHPDRIFGTKKGSPMVLGFGKDERYISSDYRALIGLIDDYIILEDGDIFMMTPEEYTILSEDREVNRDRHDVDEDENPVELGDFPHFMLKEIYEQQTVLQEMFRGRINFETNTLHSDVLEELVKEEIEKITIVASGTSYHSGLVGKYYLEEYADIETDVIVSAEFKYKKKFIDPKTLFVFVSQSGETADVLDSLKIVKEQGGNVFGIVNVPGSAIARTTGRGLYTRAGIEIGVASTKAFTTQVATFLFMALYLGKHKNLEYKKYREILENFRKIPDAIATIYDAKDTIQGIAKKYSIYKHVFYLGRGIELPIALEGSLKLKEISYIHSEAYASGELKHGPIALIDENFPTLIVNGASELYEKNISTVQEIKARNGTVVGIISENDPKKQSYDDVLTFPHIHSELDIFLETVVLQLFSYFVALELDRDIDKPRNLAKSVTVE